MPRYYFHVHDGTNMPDDTGTDLADDNAARAEAVILSGEMLKDLGPKFWKREDWHVQVIREDSAHICHLTLVATMGSERDASTRELPVIGA